MKNYSTMESFSIIHLVWFIDFSPLRRLVASHPLSLARPLRLPIVPENCFYKARSLSAWFPNLYQKYESSFLLGRLVRC